MNKIVITPLGTISPYPKGNMNCPGFLVEYNGKRILLDCGNGITRLMNLPEDLKDLNIIVTHYHKDHIGDLGSLQYASYVYHNLGMLDKKINIYLPKNDFAHNREAILSNNESYANYHDITDSSSFAVDDLNVSFNDNKSHTVESYMVKLQSDDFKVIYTSDIGTTNMEELIRFCKNANIIICESSFIQKHNSNSKTHMTALDAGTLAREANANKLVLTHLWPEEDRSLYLEEAKRIFPNTEVAEEGKKLVLTKK